MEVIQAKSAGFCFGVARAVKMAQELAKTAERPRMLGSVIHNGHVTAELERQGMRTIENPREARPGDSVLGWGGRSTGCWRNRGRAWWTPPAPGLPICSALWRRQNGRGGSR